MMGVPALLLHVNAPAELRPVLETVVGWEMVVIVLSEESQHERWIQREVDALVLGVSALAGRVFWASTVPTPPPVPNLFDVRDYDAAFPVLLSAIVSGAPEAGAIRARPPLSG